LGEPNVLVRERDTAGTREETAKVSKELLDSIPQTDPRAGYLAQRPAIDAAIARVLDGGLYVLGREVETFEAAFAAFVGTAHAIGVGNGTDAIELALRACGIGSGDLVFTVSHTAVATIAAVERAGAIAVLIDVEPGTCTMASHELSRALRMPPPGRPAAVLPVHLYGEPADLPLFPRSPIGTACV
jgi:dTDP-4-amino-4,6-dideoxygalactose transaminase